MIVNGGDGNDGVSDRDVSGNVNDVDCGRRSISVMVAQMRLDVVFAGL